MSTVFNVGDVVVFDLQPPTPDRTYDVTELDPNVIIGGVAPLVRVWPTDPTDDRGGRWVSASLLKLADLNRVRPCSGGCGLAAEDGDVFCPGCREGHDRDRTYDDPDRLAGY